MLEGEPAVNEVAVGRRRLLSLIGQGGPQDPPEVSNPTQPARGPTTTDDQTPPPPAPDAGHQSAHPSPVQALSIDRVAGGRAYRGRNVLSFQGDRTTIHMTVGQGISGP
jgi:hypothetical protein